MKPYVPWALTGLSALALLFLVTRARARGAITVHLVGDSQACIVGQLATSPQPGFLQGATAVGTVDCKYGSRIHDWLPRIDALPIAPGDLVLLFLGSNEMDSASDPAPLVQSILRRGGRPIWVGPPLIRGHAGAFIPHAQARLAALGVPYFDSRTLHLQQDAAQVHPANAAEAQRWLESVLRFANA